MNKKTTACFIRDNPRWKLSKNGKSLWRVYACRDFRDAMDFIVRVGAIAEQMNHHPDIYLKKYSSVTLRLTTHSRGELSLLDLKLALKADSQFQSLAA